MSAQKYIIIVNNIKKCDKSHLNTPAALETGIGYMSFMSWFYALIGYKMSTDGLLRGAGDMLMFTVANLINLSLRVILAVTLAPVFGVHMVWYAVPVGWFINFALGYLHYRTGKWKRIFKEKTLKEL